LEDTFGEKTERPLVQEAGAKTALVVAPLRRESPRLSAILGCFCVFVSPEEAAVLLANTWFTYSLFIIDAEYVMSGGRAEDSGEDCLAEFLMWARKLAGNETVIVLRATLGLGGSACTAYELDGWYAGRLTQEVWNRMREGPA
jgi:hypothetical protein